LQGEDRELQGRKLMLYRGPGTSAGGAVELHLRGLPHNDPTWRYLASAIALALLVAFGVYAMRGASGGASREKLEQPKEHLLGELAALERVGEASGASRGSSREAVPSGMPAKADGGDKRERKKQELTARLVRIYRELDELR